VDELNSVLGSARSICQNADVCSWTEAIQKALFRLGAALATAPETEKKKAEPSMTSADVDELTNLVHKIEDTPGILSDWSLPGAHTEASGFEISRTVCRRAVRLMESADFVDPQVLAYLNRLSDLLWLFGRLLEVQGGVDSKLRDDTQKSTRWSKAW
jgi:cob(I)alamin adenosyltransferase